MENFDINNFLRRNMEIIRKFINAMVYSMQIRRYWYVVPINDKII